MLPFKFWIKQSLLYICGVWAICGVIYRHACCKVSWYEWWMVSCNGVKRLFRVHFPSMESTEQHSVPWMCHVDEAQYGLRQVAEDDTLPDSWNSWEQSRALLAKSKSWLQSVACVEYYSGCHDGHDASISVEFFWITSVDIKLVGKTAELRNFRQTCQKLLLLCIQRVWRKLPHSCTWTLIILIPGTLWTARFLMRDWCCWWMITVFESNIIDRKSMNMSMT